MRYGVVMILLMLGVGLSAQCDRVDTIYTQLGYEVVIPLDQESHVTWFLVDRGWMDTIYIPQMNAWAPRDIYTWYLLPNGDTCHVDYHIEVDFCSSRDTIYLDLVEGEEVEIWLPLPNITRLIFNDPTTPHIVTEGDIRFYWNPVSCDDDYKEFRITYYPPGCKQTDIYIINVECDVPTLDPRTYGCGRLLEVVEGYEWYIFYDSMFTEIQEGPDNIVQLENEGLYYIEVEDENGEPILDSIYVEWDDPGGIVTCLSRSVECYEFSFPEEVEVGSWWTVYFDRGDTDLGIEYVRIYKGSTVIHDCDCPWMPTQRGTYSVEVSYYCGEIRIIKNFKVKVT